MEKLHPDFCCECDSRFLHVEQVQGATEDDVITEGLFQIHQVDEQLKCPKS